MVVMRFTALHDLFFCISAEKAFKTDITNHAYQERRGIILGFGIEIHSNEKSYRIPRRWFLALALCVAHRHESKISKVRGVVFQFIQQSHMHWSPTTLMLTSPLLASRPDTSTTSSGLSCSSSVWWTSKKQFSTPTKRDDVSGWDY